MRIVDDDIVKIYATPYSRGWAQVGVLDRGLGAQYIRSHICCCYPCYVSIET